MTQPPQLPHQLLDTGSNYLLTRYQFGRTLHHYLARLKPAVRPRVIQAIATATGVPKREIEEALGDYEAEPERAPLFRTQGK